MKRRSPIRFRQCATVAICLLPLLLSGCFNEQYYVHRDLVTSEAGDAIASNKAIQTIDPWPPYARNTDLVTDGQRAETAADNYRQNKGATQQSNTSLASSIANAAVQATGATQK